MNQKITDLITENCYGCGACYNICPKNAIKMEENKEGFKYPSINKDKCCDCGLCSSICPLNNIQYKNTSFPACIAAAAEDKYRKESSSGGIFPLLAEEILKDQGFVCGAVFKNNIVEHAIIDNLEDLKKMQGSKYVQSDIKDIYKQIKVLLENNKKILFSGTPCQVNGLNNYLQKKYSNLITVDIVCHGTPSPAIYQKYISEFETETGNKVLYTKFRDKNYGWFPLTTTIITDKNEQFPRLATCDNYMKAFLNNISLRKSCYDCQFHNIPREADITLGDFWGINDYYKNLDDSNGTSLVLVNSQNGQQLIEKIKNKCLIFKEMPIDIALKTNPCIYKSVEKPEQNRKLFFKLISEGKTLQEAVDTCLNDYCDYLLINFWWSGCNYGAVITAYAMQKLIDSFGYTTKLLDSGEAVKFKNYKQTCFYRFSKLFLNVTKQYSYKQAKELSNKIKGIIVGSDQVLRPTFLKDAHINKYLAKFASINTKKIVFSGSFGEKEEDFINNTSNRNIIKKMKRELSSFDYLSSREIQGVDIFKNIFNLNADYIIDPVFLIDTNTYDEIITDSEFAKEKIVSYILDQDEQYESAIKYLERKYKTKRYTINPALGNIEVGDWLAAIKNCKMLITDSFHGCCFALIYNKPFICLKNSLRGEDRFDSLTKIFNVKKPFIKNFSEIYKLDLENYIDYKEFNEKLEIEKNRCKVLIKEVLASNYTNNPSAKENKINNSKKQHDLSLQNIYKYLIYKLMSKFSTSKRKKSIYKEKARIQKISKYWC